MRCSAYSFPLIRALDFFKTEKNNSKNNNNTKITQTRTPIKSG